MAIRIRCLKSVLIEIQYTDKAEFHAMLPQPYIPLRLLRAYEFKHMT